MVKKFDGEFFVRSLDQARLSKQISRVLEVLKGGRWMQVARIAQLTGDPEASVSAQIRNLRKPRNGGYVIVTRRSKSTGLFSYQMQLDSRGRPVRESGTKRSVAENKLLQLSKSELVARVLRLRRKIRRLQSQNSD